MRFFDAHTHAQFAAFRDDWKEVIGRALAQGVSLVNVGSQKDTSRKAVEIARLYEEGVYATVGLHPIHTIASFHDSEELGGFPPGSGQAAKGFMSRVEEFDYDYYKNLASDPKVVAIGECGLDYAAFVREQRERAQKRASAEAAGEGGLPPEEIERQKQKQKAAFIKQIELAHEVKKPLMIHCRDAFGDLIDVLRASRFELHDAPGIAHFFTGTTGEAEQLLEMGFYFTFGGVITFSRDYDEIVRMIPMDRILSETDAPYVAPIPYRGKRNEPAYVVEVVKKLAEIKNVSVEEITEQIWENAKLIFGLREKD